MKTRLRSPLLAIALAVFSLASCEKPVTYSYFDVTVKLDQVTIDDDLRGLINSCGVTVTGDANDTASLGCVRGQVAYDFGHFDYSTAENKGKLKFIITMKDLNEKELASGESNDIGIVPNVTVPVTITVYKNVAATEPDAGARNDTGSD